MKIKFKNKNYLVFATAAFIAAAAYIYGSERLYPAEKPVPRSSGWVKEANPSFRGRGNAQAVVFQDKIWILGGIAGASAEESYNSNDSRPVTWDSKISPEANEKYSLGGEKLNDVWSSEDGANWINAAASTPWSPRRNLAAAVYDGKIWIAGGYADGRNLGDVWSSADGANWTMISDSAPWGPRRGHSLLSYAGKMWVLGGAGGGPDEGWEKTRNDVWFSTDGANWTQALGAAPWEPRYDHTALVFKDKIWVLGGWKKWGENENLSDVWFSENGKDWTAATPQAPWLPRWGHAAVSYADKIWVLGGCPYSLYKDEIVKGDLNDVWQSADGAAWSPVEFSNRWEARRGMSALVFRGKIWVLGGLSGHYRQSQGVAFHGDAWSYSDK